MHTTTTTKDSSEPSQTKPNTRSTPQPHAAHTRNRWPQPSCVCSALRYIVTPWLTIVIIHMITPIVNSENRPVHNNSSQSSGDHHHHHRCCVCVVWQFFLGFVLSCRACRTCLVFAISAQTHKKTQTHAAAIVDSIEPHCNLDSGAVMVVDVISIIIVHVRRATHARVTDFVGHCSVPSACFVHNQTDIHKYRRAGIQINTAIQSARPRY